MDNAIAFDGPEVAAMAELLRAQALAAFARTVDESIAPLAPELRALLLNRWKEIHGIDEFKQKCLVFLKLLDDYTTFPRD